MPTLYGKLKLIEEKAERTVRNTELSGNDRWAAEKVNIASTLLDWTRFALPIVHELERAAPDFDFGKVQANGYRSLLEILNYCVDDIQGQVINGRLHKIDIESLRAFAQSCQLVLFGLVIREFGHYELISDSASDSDSGLDRNTNSNDASTGISNASERRWRRAEALIPQNSAIAHSCFQKIAARCDNEINSSHYTLARVAFGYSLPLRYLLRLVHAATIAVHDATKDWNTPQPQPQPKPKPQYLNQSSEYKGAKGHDRTDITEKKTIYAENESLNTCEAKEWKSYAIDTVQRVIDSFFYLQSSTKLLNGFVAVLKAVTLALPVRAIERVRVDRGSAIAQTCDVYLVQRCWNLSELPLIHAGELITAPSIGHVEVLHLHFPKFTVPIRIVCPFSRRHHTPSSKSKSTRLILHVHGGGFVAHTSKSHEGYLRRVANELQVPIVSVDYSTAPQSCFPLPVHECYAVYKWIFDSVQRYEANTHFVPNDLTNCNTARSRVASREREREEDCDGDSVHNLSVFQLLRKCSTCENVCLMGDSAGGNLLMSVLERAIVNNQRLPLGLVALYTPMLLRFAPSPSRVVTLVDPLVPSRTLSMCILAYFGRDLDKTLEELERDCLHHSSERNMENPDNGDEIQLCDDCAQVRVAGHLIGDLLCKMSRLRAQLFRDVPTAGRTRWEQQRAACAFSKLQAVSLIENRASKTQTAKVHDHENEVPNSEPLCWPVAVMKRLPRIALITPSRLDPTIDDNVDFAKRLSALGKAVTLDAVDNVPHGFMNFANICPNSSKGLTVCVTRLREIFEAGSAKV